jgi:hypothetical protein
MGVVIGIIIGFESRDTRAPATPAHGGRARLTQMAVFGRIPILLSDDTGLSYDGDAARDKINPLDGQCNRVSDTLGATGRRSQ